MKFFYLASEKNETVSFAGKRMQLIKLIIFINLSQFHKYSVFCHLWFIHFVEIKKVMLVCVT